MLRLTLILGTLAALGPLSIDTYLPSFPLLAASLGVATEAVPRTLASYFLGMACGQLIWGATSDRYGRRRPLLTGLTLYLAATIGCALAPDIHTLTILRFFQALGGCAGMVLSRAVVRDSADERGTVKLMSQLMLVMGLAPILGPLLGGWLLGFGWRAIFWTLAFYAAAIWLLVLLLLPETLPPERRRDDTPLQMLGVFATLLRDRRFMGYALSTAFPFAGMFAYIAGSPFVFIELFGTPAQYFGLIFGANAAGFILVAQFNSRLMKRYGAAPMLQAALLVQSAAALVMLADAATGFGGFAGILVPLFVYMACLGMIGPLATSLAIGPHGRMAGSASAVLGTFQFGSGSIIGWLIATLHNGTALPMVGLMAVAGLAGLCSKLFLARERG